MEHNFRKIATLNQGTPYDYNSVMQYHRWDTGVTEASLEVLAGLESHSSVQPNRRYAFSKNGQPTMVPIPNANVSFGNAKQMSQYDIARLNTLYKCCEWPQTHPTCPQVYTPNVAVWLLHREPRVSQAWAEVPRVPSGVL